MHVAVERKFDYEPFLWQHKKCPQLNQSVVIRNGRSNVALQRASAPETGDAVWTNDSCNT